MRQCLAGAQWGTFFRRGLAFTRRRWFRASSGHTFHMQHDFWIHWQPICFPDCLTISMGMLHVAMSGLFAWCRSWWKGATAAPVELHLLSAVLICFKFSAFSESCLVKLDNIFICLVFDSVCVIPLSPVPHVEVQESWQILNISPAPPANNSEVRR